MTNNSCDSVLRESLAVAGEDDKTGGFASRLAFAFALVAAFTAILGGLLSFVVWDMQFDRYVRKNLQAMADNVATVGALAYHQYEGWNFGSFAVIPQVGITDNVAVQILSNDGSIVYDEASLRAHSQRMYSSESEHASDEGAVDSSLYLMTAHPGGEVTTSDVVVHGVVVGTVRVWPYGSKAFLTDRDRELRSTSLAALTVAAVVAIIIASVAGFVYSRRLVSPINCITATAMAIRAGDASARTSMHGEDEISLLGETFDKMADSIEAERTLERRLTSDVAHELRTPLMAIQATIEAIEDGVVPADAHHLGTVSNETRRLGRLTNAILELSRLENISMPFSFAVVDLSTPVRAAIDSHRALFEAHNITVTDNIAAGVEANCDSDRIQQALASLLSNAARYTSEGGKVGVSLYAENNFAVIEVSDTGMGISPENQANLFRRFWRADEARDRQSGGIGVGLSIAKEIIDRHNGFIDIESEAGVGTTFKIRIPLV